MTDKSTTPVRRIPVTDAQYALVNQYRVSTKRAKDALHWIKSDLERTEREMTERKHRPYGSTAAGVATQAVKLAQASEALENIVELAEITFGKDHMDDFYALVDWTAMPDYTATKEN